MPTETNINALRLLGNALLLVRAIDHETRSESDADRLDLVDLGVLGKIGRGVSLPSLIARSLKLDPGRVTRVVDQLVASGYVERRTDEDDRRRCPLLLTASGERRLQIETDHLAATIAKLLSSLDEREREHLEAGLEAVRRVLEGAY